MAKNRITIGSLIYGHDKMSRSSSSAILTNSLISQELSIDEGSFVVYDPTGACLAYSYGEPVTYEIGSELVAKLYLKNIDRIKTKTYRLNCVSNLDTLSRRKHYGGVYNGAVVPDVLSDIMGDSMTYSVNPVFNNVRVYGWLPVDWARNNLRRLLFAIGGIIAKSKATGNAYITFLDSSVIGSIPLSRTYMKGGGANGAQGFTGVEVTEHAFVALSGDDGVTLFSGTANASTFTAPSGIIRTGTLVIWGADNGGFPCHDLAATGTTILESGYNYAVIAASSSCTLTGKRYTHTRRVLRLNASIPGEENIQAISDNCLVSLANSGNVLERAAAYYCNAKTYRVPFKLGSERPADYTSFYDMYGNQHNGFVKKLELTPGASVCKAVAEMVADYTPGGIGNYYICADIITSDGKWKVPWVYDIGVDGLAAGTYGFTVSGASWHFTTPGLSAGDRLVYNGTSTLRVWDASENAWGASISLSSGLSGTTLTLAEITDIFRVAIGGGKGGNKGNNGANGSTNAGGAGGLPGESGSGGKINTDTLSVNSGQTFDITIGLGGQGETAENPASPGTATTFGTLSSDNGAESINGFRDIFSGNTYGAKGIAGELAGGTGSGASGVGPSVTKNGVTYYAGANGSPYTAYGSTANGGYGGGAASAGNGWSGWDGYVNRSGGYSYGFTQNNAAVYSALYGSTGRSWYSFDPATGSFTLTGATVNFGTSNVLGYAIVGGNLYEYSMSGGSFFGRISYVIGSGYIVTVTHGQGGRGGQGGAGADASDYGQGGQGGDGGGGGGQSTSSPGVGGQGGPGGKGANGCAIVYF